METAPQSGHNELRAEELVTWKVAGRVNDISYIRDGGKGEQDRQREGESLLPLRKKGHIKIKMKIKGRLL